MNMNSTTSDSRLYKFQENIIEGMATLVESRDLTTGEHVERTRRYVNILLNRLRFCSDFSDVITDEYIHNVTLSSMLHDIGKIFISDVLLNKPGKLSDSEMAIMRTHTTLGSEIIDYIFGNRLNESLYASIRDIVLCHHERFDGKGYPLGLSGDDIPLSARIVSVADVFDALTSKRPYKEAMDIESALDILKKDSSSAFDPRIVDCFIDCKRSIQRVFYNSASKKRPSLQIYGDFERKLQQESIITGLTEDYEVVVYIRPESETVTFIRSESIGALKRFSESSSISLDLFISSILESAPEDDCDLIIQILGKENIHDNFEYMGSKYLVFRQMENDNIRYYRMKLSKVGASNSNSFDILVGIRDVTDEELTREAEKRQLFIAKKEAEIANSAKTEFIRSLSRDIRSPFSTLVGFTNLSIRDINDVDKIREYLYKMKQSEEELSVAIDRLLEVDSSKNSSESSEATPREEMIRSDLIGKRILVVDDNVLNLEIVKSVLETLGASVECASNGSIAVNLVSTHLPRYYDAILMDVQMGVMGGIEATMRIRALDDKETASVPIIAMTASSFEKDKQLVMSCGMDSYLTKPLDVDTLLKILS